MGIFPKFQGENKKGLKPPPRIAFVGISHSSSTSDVDSIRSHLPSRACQPQGLTILQILWWRAEQTDDFHYPFFNCLFNRDPYNGFITIPI